MTGSRLGRALAIVACAAGLASGSACRGPARPNQAIDPSPAVVGDVVFFRTVTWRGYVVRLLELGHDDYSHVGIVAGNGPGGLTIVHAAPVGAAGEDGTVQVEPLRQILARSEIADLAFYRPRAAPAAAEEGVRIASRYAARKTPFDHDFDLTDDGAVYCTELIFLAYRGAGLDLHASGRIVYPSDLLQSGFFSPLGKAAEAARLNSPGPLGRTR